MLVRVLVLLRLVVAFVCQDRVLQHEVTNHRVGLLKPELAYAFIFDLFAEEWLCRWLVDV